MDNGIRVIYQPYRFCNCKATLPFRDEITSTATTENMGTEVKCTKVKANCVLCVETPKHTYYKNIWNPTGPAEYVCRSTATLVSKFGYIVDSPCDKNGCMNISSRPLLRNS
jgi:hypothetical protein